MQQQRLLPLLASAFAFHVTGAEMLKMLTAGDAEALHVASAGLKVTAVTAVTTVDQLPFPPRPSSE